MLVCIWVYMSVLLRIADGFIIRGSSAPLVVPLGASVVLPCSVDKPLLIEGLEVEWKRTDSKTLVHLFQDGESRPETQQQDYHDRAHFFTEEIQHGNFSLLLNNVRAEDKGGYRCTVHSEQDSAETVIEIKDVERLIVSGSNHSISAYAGEDVTLSCSVDSHIPPEEIEQVSWKKTDEDENIVVLLIEKNEILSDSADERYRDRVEFFTDEIPKGNFSLRLKSVRTEDKGVYMCEVTAGDFSANTTVVLEQLGFSSLHIMVLILCIAASGSALLICSLTYCRSNTGFIVQHIQRVHQGGSVVLPCLIDPHLVKEGLKVEWRRTDSETLVHLFQDGESRPETQQQDYHDRAHFFTEEIQHGNFSLLLNNVRAEDKGGYRCKVYRRRASVFSAKINLEPRLLGSLFIVRYSCERVVPLGGSVVLPCFIDPQLLMELRVKWKRTDSETLVHLFQDGESRPEAQQQDYYDRAHFFTEEIQHGNFSLLLNNVRAEDKGEYRCTVYGQDDFLSSTTLETRLLDVVFSLRMFLVFCPNILMFVAFVLWGVTEGSLNETVSCCALYFLRPLMLLWAAPYVKEFTGVIKTLVLKYSYQAEYLVLSAVVYAALLNHVWGKIMSYAGFDKVIIIIMFGIVFLCCFCKIMYILVAKIGKKTGRIIGIFDIVAYMGFEILPALQFMLLFYSFGATGGGFIIIIILPLLLTMTNDTWLVRCIRLDCSDAVIGIVQNIVMLLMTAVMMGFYIITLEKEKEPIGWACVIGFLQILWAVWKSLDFSLTFYSGFHRFVPLYLFGSVGVVLLNSVTLMTELILKTVNGERSVGDLRFVVFPAECLFVLAVVISAMFESRIKTCLQSCQNAVKSIKTPASRSQQNQSSQNAAGSEETPASGSKQNQNSAESHELTPLNRRGETEPDSVVSQS